MYHFAHAMICRCSKFPFSGKDMASKHFLCIPVLFVLCQMFCEMASPQCGGEYSIYGMMLQGHTFKTIKTLISFECLQACYDDVRCQSFNYVISQDVCELNDRTKEARPEDFLPDSNRYYYKKVKKRGIMIINYYIASNLIGLAVA